MYTDYEREIMENVTKGKKHTYALKSSPMPFIIYNNSVYKVFEYSINLTKNTGETFEYYWQEGQNTTNTENLNLLIDNKNKTYSETNPVRFALFKEDKQLIATDDVSSGYIIFTALANNKEESFVIGYTFYNENDPLSPELHQSSKAFSSYISTSDENLKQFLYVTRYLLM